jgi:Spy/CpxP family protein refolding chaperone
VIKAKGLAIAMYLGAALAGAAIALAADRAYTTTRGGRPGAPRAMRTRYFDQLQLTAPQRDSATALFDERDRKFKALSEKWKSTLEPLRAAQDSLYGEWKEQFTRLLTPEQKARYDQLQAARRDQQHGMRPGPGR